MNFREKFEKMIDIVEINVDKDAHDVDQIIGKELGVSGRVANQAFSFITSLRFSDYVRCRKLTKVIEEIQNKTEEEIKESRDIIASTAFKYGYSDRSTFDRAFKRDFNVTPADVINNNTPYNCMARLTLDMIMENSMESGINVETTIDEKTTAAVIDNLVNSGSMIINLESDKDRMLLNEIMDCQALYCLSTDQVLLAYELSEDKSSKGLSRACEAISFATNELGAREIDDELRDALYLVVNNNLYFEEAQRIVSDIHNGSKVDIRRIDKVYLDMVVKYNYENGLILENLPYDAYAKLKPVILNSLNESTGLNIKAKSDGTITAGLFREACTLLAIDFTEEELLEFSDRTAKIVDLMLASILTNVWIPREKATAVIDDLKKIGVNDWRECDEGYKNILFNTYRRTPLLYSSYLSLLEDLNEYGVTDEHEIHAVIKKTAEKGWDGPFEEVVDEILYKKRLGDKYHLSIEDVEDLSELTNTRVSWDDVCTAYKENIGKKLVMPIEAYGNAMTHLNDEAKERHNKAVFTLGERLALMISLNSEKPYKQVKAEIEKEFSEYGLDFNFSDYLYYMVNKVAIDAGIKETYTPMAYADYRYLVKKTEEEVKTGEIRGLDLVFFSAVAFQCGLYDSLDESFSWIKQLLRRVRELIPDYCNLGIEGTCYMYMWDEALVSKKPHELDDKQLVDLIRDGILCDMEEDEPRPLTESERMHMRMQTEMWAPAMGWELSAPVTREQLH